MSKIDYVARCLFLELYLFNEYGDSEKKFREWIKQNHPTVETNIFDMNQEKTD